MSFIYLSYFSFVLRYRRTSLGPLWILVGPSLFIFFIGLLFAEIGTAQPEVFIPHLAVGLITWTMIGGVIVASATVFKRSRPQILQGTLSLERIVAVEVTTTLLSFMHQLPIVLIIFLIYGIGLNWIALESFLGLGLLVANGVWVSYVFGILGTRYRDLVEIFNALMRLAFLATPIIWMPGEGMRGGVMAAALIYNPFYHFVEVIRAPLLGQSPALLSWEVVFGFTAAGFLAAWFLKKRYARLVPFWL